MDGVLNGDDRRIFLGLKFFIAEFLGGYGIQNNLKIRGSASACVSRPRSSANEVQPKLFCGWSREFSGLVRDFFCF